MEEQQLKDCLNIVVQAERDLESAKEAYKDITESAFDTYDCTGNEAKAIKKVAKAMLKNKVSDTDDEISALVEVIGAVKK